MGDRGTNETSGGDADANADGNANANETAGEAASAPGGEDAGAGPRELSRAAAIGATVVCIVSGCVAMLAVLHWLGWTVPGIGWIVAKAGIKLSVGGFAVLAVAADHLRGKLRAKPRS
ncbi:hypothetical protein [Streptomyces sp. CBMA123]|uniref:hypothetical protein n=1 Tax=Streptomyces sp. CBMA123 TaxID=1896313 RepID=UPI0016619076|nr:hypothetical protein [Streptomyces sp. CBMA123]